MDINTLPAQKTDKEKKLCLIYANCQGRAFDTFLRMSAEFQEKYRIEIVNNYIFIQNKHNLPLDTFKKADLFIYQPIAAKHGVYATDNLFEYLPPQCVKISFPYIYNDALWPLFEVLGEIKGQEVVVSLIESGLSLKEIVDRFCAGKIDFQFERRFSDSMAILRSKEEKTDVKVADFIVSNFRTKKLFLTHNHHTNAIYIHCANQILNILHLPLLHFVDKMPAETCLGDCWPQSPYETNFYGLTYQYAWQEYHPEKIDSNWHRFYLKLIGKIYFSFPLPWLKRVSLKSYLYLRIKRDLVWGAGYMNKL